jgi:hypothetical protein
VRKVYRVDGTSYWLLEKRACNCEERRQLGVKGAALYCLGYNAQLRGTLNVYSVETPELFLSKLAK